MQNALNRLFKLKQNNRFYVEYFEKVKKIEKNLSKEIVVIISIRLIQELNMKILRMLVREIMSQNTMIDDTTRLTSNLEAIIRIIKDVLRDMNKKNVMSSKQIKYRDLKLFDRTLTKIFEANSKLMIETLESNVKVMKFMMRKFISQNRNQRSIFLASSTQNQQSLQLQS